MENMMRAIQLRTSRRSYIDVPINVYAENRLHSLIDRYNMESGLHIQLIENEPTLFAGFFASYGLFTGVQNYFALVGKKNDTELLTKCGYFGEKLVLEATMQGLGTCFVGGSYKRERCKEHIDIKDGEKLVCVIVVGNVEPEKTAREKNIAKATKRRTKPIKAMYTSAGEVPFAFEEGLKAVQLAPSAGNSQPVQGVDLGIAMLHFEIGSGCGSWRKENDRYVLDMKSWG